MILIMMQNGLFVTGFSSGLDSCRVSLCVIYDRSHRVKGVNIKSMFSAVDVITTFKIQVLFTISFTVRP